ncbi:hypothetical protein GQ43DRAFT_455123 [Delitschia confertaspora ATCC 74209]|uniref:Uncharacterized protein n=1 Tax=Delitschia confertaspora ATCC 74209 TaxID=1513339 RepID=A0A9P4JNN0_9PLEO|nr:hypothetical protein GQ43DRAFT_455123 [Delitschia confertaspora ATCC 74209]
MNNSTTTPTPWDGKIDPNTPFRGFISSPNSRGTFEIISSCFLTIFLCGWVSVCINIPAPTAGKFAMFFDKCYMFLFSLLGPDFVGALALGQYMAARESVKAFKESGYGDWTTKHAFYANMGGFVVKPEDGRIPGIDKAMIDDRNKADGLTRILTVSQILWFSASVLARPFQGLAITTLEVTTIAFIFSSLFTSFCWRDKPMDVKSAVVIELETPLADILREAGDLPDQVLPRYNPLDFVSQDEWIITILWHYYTNILKTIFFIKRKREWPAQKIPSFDFPSYSAQGEILSAVFVFPYLCIFFAAWNFEFPTATEKLLWCIASVSTMIMGFVGALYEGKYSNLGCGVADILRRWGSSFFLNSADSTGLPRPAIAQQIERFDKFLRNNSAGRVKMLEVPRRSFVVTHHLCALYTICRIYIFVEDFMGLRVLPASAFRTVEWNSFWPHF